MDRWINAASALMEQLLNRPVKPRDIVEQLDGNGRPTIYTLQSPAIALHALRVYDPDFADFDDIQVQTTNDVEKEVDFQATRGRLVLLPDSPIAYFTQGSGNVQITYRAGFLDHDLAVIQEAAIDLIAVRWNELGRNPREQSRSDTINTLSTFAKGDFDELPWMTTQAVMTYRRRGV